MSRVTTSILNALSTTAAPIYLPLPLLLLLLLNLPSPGTTAGLNCFFPDGSLAPNRYACYPTEAESYCCPLSYACMDNKICKSVPTSNTQFGSLRGSCTDKSFNDPACPQFCLKSNNGRDKEDIVFGCPDTTNEFCCEGDPCQHGDIGKVICNDTTPTFSVQGEGLIQTIIGEAQSATPLPLTASSSPSSSSFSSSSSSSKSKSSSSSRASITSTSIPNEPAITSSTSQPPLSLSPSTSTPSPSSSSTNSSSTNSAAIGAGVGVPLGILAIAGISFFFWRRERKLKRDLAHARGGGDHGANGGAGYGYERGRGEMSGEGRGGSVRPQEMGVKEEVGYELGGGGGVLKRAEMPVGR